MRSAVPAVMLGAMGVFHLVASFATFIPTFVHDRMAKQFVPVWQFLLTLPGSSPPSESWVKAMAVGSQFVIGFSEAAIGLTLLCAAAMGRRRMGLASFALAWSAGLFSVFMLTMFAMHDKNLPAWNQYPAILAWIGVTWVAVALSSGGSEKPSEGRTSAS